MSLLITDLCSLIPGNGTPIGRFAFRRLLYRADRVPHIATRLPARHVEPEDGWCDDPADSAYNKPVRLPRPTRHETILPHPARHERLWRDDHLYDLVVVIGHNDDPVVKGAGSAVFVHVAHEAWSPTGGCIAFRREDLLWILARVTTNDAVVTGSQKTEIRSQSSE